MVLNDLGQTIIPSIFDTLQSVGIGETVDILSESNSKDSGGAGIKTQTTPYSNIKIPPPEKSTGLRVVVGDKPISYGNYKFTLPVYKSGSRIDLTAKMKIKVLARGLEPEKIFSIIDIFNDSGVSYEVEAKLES